MESPTKLTALYRILLNLARSKDFPNGSARRGFYRAS
jgi:hypothetical protein